MDDDQGSVETFGEYLSRERRLRNIHLEEIAEKTRVSVKMLQALESDAYALLPPRVYVIGFLQAYARHVGLDGNEVVLRYEDYIREIEGSQGDTKRQWQTRRKPLIWVALILTGLALAAAYLLWWRTAPHPGLREPLQKQGAVQGTASQSKVALPITQDSQSSNP